MQHLHSPGYLSDAIIRAAKDHARAEFPKESCGIVVGDDYVPCPNIAEDPENDFEIPTAVSGKLFAAGKVKAILHSHPNGPLFPSQKDMLGQIATNVPWGIVVLDQDGRISEPLMWGDALPIVPLVGRTFMHGIADCYTLVRDIFRLGKEGMAAQGMPDWPFDPVTLPEVPRDDSWWSGDDDLYTAHLEKEGFKVIPMEQVRPGDCFLKALGTRDTNPHNKLNHAGALVSPDLLLHHLPARLSVREPASLWGRAADLWVRYDA